MSQLGLVCCGVDGCAKRTYLAGRPPGPGSPAGPPRSSICRGAGERGPCSVGLVDSVHRIPKRHPRLIFFSRLPTSARGPAPPAPPARQCRGVGPRPGLRPQSQVQGRAHQPCAAAPPRRRGPPRPQQPRPSAGSAKPSPARCPRGPRAGPRTPPRRPRSCWRRSSTPAAAAPPPPPPPPPPLPPCRQRGPQHQHRAGRCGVNERMEKSYLKGVSETQRRRRDRGRYFLSTYTRGTRRRSVGFRASSTDSERRAAEPLPPRWVVAARRAIPGRSRARPTRAVSASPTPDPDAGRCSCSRILVCERSGCGRERGDDGVDKKGKREVSGVTRQSSPLLPWDRLLPDRQPHPVCVVEVEALARQRQHAACSSLGALPRQQAPHAFQRARA
jgi:hypothetical protein